MSSSVNTAFTLALVANNAGSASGIRIYHLFRSDSYYDSHATIGAVRMSVAPFRPATINAYLYGGDDEPGVL